MRTAINALNTALGLCVAVIGMAVMGGVVIGIFYVVIDSLVK